MVGIDGRVVGAPLMCRAVKPKPSLRGVGIAVECRYKPPPLGVGSLTKYPIPEDVQTWSYLALEDPAYAASVDWASARLAVTDTPEARNATLTSNVNFSGVTFSNGSMQADPTVAPNGYTPKPNLSAVWFEGTAHIADALLFRDTRDSSATVLGDDRALAAFYLSNIQRAQALLGQNQTVGGKALAPGYGIVASSSPIDSLQN